MEVEGQQMFMPKSYEKMNFKHHFQKLRCPCVVYADFECLTEELKKPDEDKITFSYQEHKPCGFTLNMHCHFTGKCRGCAHSVCNLNSCNRYFKIPVFFHNMKSYDGHLIIQNADNYATTIN